MANSTIKITFTELALAGLDIYGEEVLFDFFHNTNVEVKETFASYRTMPFAVTTLTPPRPTRLKEAIDTDYPSLFDITLVGDDAILITSLFDEATFTAVSDDFFIYEIVNSEEPILPTLLSVQGLEGDRYLINNEIILDVTTITGVPILFKTIITNLTNQKQSTPLITYPSQNLTARMGLESVIKSLFTYPSDADGYVIPNQIVPNSNRFRIEIFFATDESELEPGTQLRSGFLTVKTFIRGGRRTTLTNQTLSGFSDRELRYTEKIPVWDGYDTAFYYLDQQNLIRKGLIADVNPLNLDFRRSKGCNETYVKFLNQKGGYSNWLFESHTETQSNSNLGGFIRDNKVDDLGNEADFKLQLNAKIPKDYRDLILDLIVSPEIYAEINGVMTRVRSGRNSIPYDEIKRAYNVSINLEVDNRFKPALLW